jgi:ribosomal protein S12 methylthiotransferase accessory factor
MPADLTDLAACARRLEGMGLTALWTEVTAPEAEGLGHVVKVIVPEMVPLSVDHGARWLATPRLRRVGDAGRPGTSAWNPFPHPFA